MTTLNTTFAAFTPTPVVRSHDWFRENLFTHEPTGGRPYDDHAYPHIGAPGGPCDASDDKRIRAIWLQWGSRLGKSFFGQSATLFAAEVEPCPMMLASADEKTAKEVTQRTYGMMTNSRCLRKHLRPERNRRQDRIDFKRCRQYVAWARSVSTLADKAVRLGHGNEIDKWEHQSTSKEADPLKLFLDRGKEFPTRKFILESTPTIKGKSRVEHGRLQSTNCKLHVPCPHCKRYQTLEMDSIVWEKNEQGKSDKDLARRTAKYYCTHCGEACEDHHRAWMMRRGVWCPEGCTVKDKEALALFDEGAERTKWISWGAVDWIEGAPVRDGNDAGYQLSSLYALSLGWGDIAAEFVGSKGKPQDFRNFVNQWLAETWEVIERKENWEQLGQRIIVNVPEGVVPPEFSFLTAGVDKQEMFYVYSIIAWGPEGRCHTVRYGVADDLAELTGVLSCQYRHADGGTPLRVHVALMDSGHRPKGVAEFCRSWHGPGSIVPCKGSSTSLNVPFKVSIQDKKSAMPGMKLVLIDTTMSQDWIESALMSGDTLKTLHAGSVLDHQDYLEQILNDAPVSALDRTNNSRESWNRIHDDIPNDYRDCERYGWAAHLIATRGKAVPPRTPKEVQRQKSEPPQEKRFFDRPGGWIPKR